MAAESHSTLTATCHKLKIIIVIILINMLLTDGDCVSYSFLDSRKQTQYSMLAVTFLDPI